jgi:uncharacterized protein YndB with AHSA1/START domain
MSRSIERSFEVPVPLERVWQVMTDPTELNRWYFPFRADPQGKLHTEVHGHERTSEVVDAEPLKRFRTRTTFTGREGFGVVPGVREMLVGFEPVASGTRVTVTHSGWADDEESQRERCAVERGTDETLADLLLYLRTRVAFPRHNRGERSYLGFTALEVPGGVEVRGVQPGTFADRLGLQRGDLLVELDGAGVFGLSDLAFFAKLRAAGETAEARWIRDGALLHGSAVLGERVAPLERAAAGR